MGAAVRVGDITGVEIRLEYLPSPRGPLYTWSARPPAARSCVVICSSVFSDFGANYHRERLLALALVDQGHGVIRFHYAGEGNSGGARGDLTVHTMRADAQVVLAHARERGFEEFGVVGTRMGCAVAASVAATLERAPVCLWEPLDDALRFVAGAQRAIRMSRATGNAVGVSQDWKSQLAEHGTTELLGYDVHAGFIESLAEADIVEALGRPARPILVARFRRRASADDPVVERLSEQGFAVDQYQVDASESWWFHSERPPESAELIPISADWLGRQMMQGTGP